METPSRIPVLDLIPGATIKVKWADRPAEWKQVERVGTPGNLTGDRVIVWFIDGTRAAMDTRYEVTVRS